MSEDSFPLKLDRKPSCALTEHWAHVEIDGSKTVRYAGADGYLYESRKDGWYRVGPNTGLSPKGE